MEEFFFSQCRFINDDINAFGLDPFHDALNRGSPEVVGIGFHSQSVDSDRFGILPDDHVGNVILAGAVAIDDGLDEVVGNILIVGWELLGA